MSFEKEFVTGEDLAAYAKTVEDKLSSLTAKVVALEGECQSLRALFSASGQTCPIERGGLLFPGGDPIPSRSHFDGLDGHLFALPDGALKRAFKLSKNTSGQTLHAGDSFAGGIVDLKLRHPCEPNNFALVEL